MITVDSTTNAYVNLDALRAAAHTTFGAAFIDCNQTQDGAVWTAYLTGPVANQQTLWDTLLAAHDPVYLTIDKNTVAADGTDFCTVTVSAPKPGAASIALQVKVPGGATVNQAVSLVGGNGLVQIKTHLYGLHTVTVLNPTNRCVDTLTCMGV